MKQILNSQNVCHHFAHQRQNELTQWQIEKNGYGFKTPTGSVFSVKDKIYSYGYHFCMGRILQSGYNGIVILSERNYSVTTSKHQRELFAACSGHLNIIYAAYPEYVPTEFDQQNGNDKNLNFYRNKIYSLREKLGNARKPEKWAEELVTELGKVRKYIELVGKYSTELTDKTIKPYRELLNEFDEVALIRDAKEYTKKQAEKLKADCIKYSSIMNLFWNVHWADVHGDLSEQQNADIVNEYNSVPQNIKNEYIKQKGHFLRVTKDGQNIETSLGVIVPINEAKSGYLAFKAGKLLGFRFAGYSVTKSDKNGFIAGCHTLKAETINRIALQLNWK